MIQAYQTQSGDEFIIETEQNKIKSARRIDG